jgi:hypothetical protein
MMSAAARRRFATLRHPRPMARLARILWIAWAVVVWNVVFDHVIVVAGRDYIAAAGRAAAAGKFANMDDWMRPAVSRGFWLATAAGGAILLTGLAAVGVAARGARRSANRVFPLHANLAQQEQPR